MPSLSDSPLTNLKWIGPDVVLERLSYLADAVFGSVIEPSEEGSWSAHIVLAPLHPGLRCLRLRDQRLAGFPL